VSKGAVLWRDVNWSSGTEVKNERNYTSAPSHMILKSLSGTTLPFYLTTEQSFQPSYEHPVVSSTVRQEGSVGRGGKEYLHATFLIYFGPPHPFMDRGLCLETAFCKYITVP